MLVRVQYVSGMLELANPVFDKLVWGGGRQLAALSHYTTAL